MSILRIWNESNKTVIRTNRSSKTHGLRTVSDSQACDAVINLKNIFKYDYEAQRGGYSRLHSASIRRMTGNILDNEIEIFLRTRGGPKGPLSPGDVKHIIRRIKTLRENYGIERPDENGLLIIQRIAHERGHSPRTEMLNRWALKYWAMAIGSDINLDKSKGIVAVPAPKLRRRSPTGKALSNKVVRLLLDDVGMPLRDKVLIAVLAYGGGRITETCKLRVADISHERKALFYRAETTKDREDRWVSLGAVEPWTLLMRWTEQRAGWLASTGKSTDLLFFTRDGKPMNEDNVRRMLYRCEQRHPEIKTMLPPGEKHLHPHLFRHTAAMMWVREGDVKQAQHQLGHRSLSTTALYLADDETARQKTSARLAY